MFREGLEALEENSTPWLRAWRDLDLSRAEGRELFRRDRLPMHLTASLRVVDRGGALLIRHPKLGIDTYPGGHVDEGETAWLAAQREAREEIGLVLPPNSRRPSLVGIGFHSIPARGLEPAHWHADLLYESNLPPGAVFSEDREPIPFVSQDDSYIRSRYWRIPAKYRVYELI